MRKTALLLSVASFFLFLIFLPKMTSAGDTGKTFKCTFKKANDLGSGMTCDMSADGYGDNISFTLSTTRMHGTTIEYIYWAPGRDWVAMNSEPGIGPYYRLWLYSSDPKTGSMARKYHQPGNNWDAPDDKDQSLWYGGKTTIANPSGGAPAPTTPPTPPAPGTGGNQPGGGTTVKPTIQPPDTKAVSLAGSFATMFGGSCSNYECWVKKVWAWATAIMIPISLIMLIAAGILYATSGGNPDKITLAKNLIFGVISGLALVVIAYVLLVNFVGVDTSIWNV